MRNINKLGLTSKFSLTMIALTLGILMFVGSSLADMTVTQLSAYNPAKHYSAPVQSYPTKAADNGAIDAGTNNVPVLQMVLTNDTGGALEQVTVAYTGTNPIDIGQVAIYDDSDNSQLTVGTLTGRDVTLFLPTTPVDGTFVIVMDVASGAASNIVDAKIKSVNGDSDFTTLDIDTDDDTVLDTPDTGGIGKVTTPNPGSVAPIKNYALIDTTKPTFEAAEYNKGTKVLKIEFDDGPEGAASPATLIKVTHLDGDGKTQSDITLSTIFLEKPDGASSVNLGGATLLKNDASTAIVLGDGGSGKLEYNTVYIKLTIAQDAHLQHTLGDADARVRVGADTLCDYQFGNTIADTDKQTMNYIADLTNPTLAGALKDVTYNYSTHILKANFSEAIPSADVDLSKWTVTNTAGETKILTGATVKDQVDTTVEITVTNGAASGTLDQDKVLKGNSATLTLADAAVKDVSGNAFAATAAKDVYVTPALLNENAAVTLHKTAKSGVGSSQVDVGYVDLQFTEELKIGNTDAAKIKLLYRDGDGVDHDLFALSQGELMGIDLQPADKRIVSFQLTPEHKETLAKHAGALRVTVEADAVKDVYDTLNAKQEKLAISSTDLAPELIVANYDHDSQELYLKFDEKIKVAYDYDAVDLANNQPRNEKVKIMVTAGAGFYLDAVVVDGASNDERISGQPSETNDFTFKLTTAHRDELSSWGKTAPADITVHLDAGAFVDLANTGNVATDKTLDAYASDTTPPAITKVKYIPTGADPDNPIRQLVITLNKPMKSTTEAGAADLTKMYVLGAPGGSQRQLSAGGTTEFVGSDVIINGVTTDTDADIDTPHEVLVNGTNPQLRLEAGAIDDLAGNKVAASYEAVDIDITAPVLQTATYDHISETGDPLALVQDGRLTLNFDEKIDTTSIDLKKIQLNSAFTLEDADGTYATVETTGEASIIEIKVTNNAKVAQISSWGISGDLFTVRLEVSALKNTAGLANAVNSKSASFTTKDTRDPKFVAGNSAYYHAVDNDPDTAGVQLKHRLELAFDEHIDTSNIDASKIWLWRDQYGYSGPSVPLSADEIKAISPSEIIKFDLTDAHARTISRWGAAANYGDAKTAIWVELRQGAVIDRAGADNPNVAVGTGGIVRQSLNTWRKDTDAGDQDSAANLTAASYNANSKALTLTFDELMDVDPVGNVDATKLKIWDHDKNSSVTLAGGASTNNETNTVTISLSYDKHAAVNGLSTPLYIRIDNAGAAHKISGEGCNTLDADHAKSVTFTPDTQAPSLVCVHDDAAKSNYTGGVLTLDFDENLNKPTTFTDAEAEAFATKFSLLPAADSTEGFALTSADLTITQPGQNLADFGGASEVKFQLTDAHKNTVNTWTAVYVTIAAGAVKDTKDNLIAEVGATKVVGIANPAPVIHIDPVVNSGPAGADLTITAAVTDNRTVAEVRLYYQVGGSIAKYMMMVSGSDYSATIPLADVTNRGLSYYIWAKDDQGATTHQAIYKNDNGDWAVNGASRATPQNVKVTGATVTLPAGSLPEFSVAVPSKYRMLSVPIQTKTSDADTYLTSTELFEPFGTAGEDWLAWQFTGSPQYNGYQAGHLDAFDCAPGVASWVATMAPDSALTATGNTVNVTENKVLTLHLGWNQIADPFNFQRSWDSETINLVNVKDQIYWFTGEDSSYSFASLIRTTPNQTVLADSWKTAADFEGDATGIGWPGTLDPWGGYWVYAYQEGATISINPTTPTKGVLPPTPSGPSAQVVPSWSVKFLAGSAGSMDAAKFAGVVTAPVDVNQYDVMDLPMLPGSNVRLSFVTEDGTYLQDMKEPADEMIWQLRATSTDALVKIGVDASAVPSEYRTVMLIDIETDERIDLRNVSSYSYKPTDQLREFKLVISKDHPEVYAAVPDKTMLLKNYPNPFNPETWIPFKLSKANDVTIRIYNLTGEIVRNIELGRREVGSYTARERAAYWDGKNQYGEQVASGVYFYHIQSGSFNATKRMVILK